MNCLPPSSLCTLRPIATQRSFLLYDHALRSVHRPRCRRAARIVRFVLNAARGVRFGCGGAVGEGGAAEDSWTAQLGY